jgi:hypothetical protein
MGLGAADDRTAVVTELSRGDHVKSRCWHYGGRSFVPWFAKGKLQISRPFPGERDRGIGPPICPQGMLPGIC